MVRTRLAEARREPRWRAFLRQFQDLLIIILLIAAVVSLVVAREWETPVVIALVVLLNATIGFAQESKAEASPRVSQFPGAVAGAWAAGTRR